MSKLKSLWRRKADARFAEPRDLYAINVFTARGRDLDAVGELLQVPRPATIDDPLNGALQRAYRLIILNAVLHAIGLTVAPVRDHIKLNNAAVTLGTYRNDPDYGDYRVCKESDEEFKDRLRAIVIEWLTVHGVDTNHVCEECCK